MSSTTFITQRLAGSRLHVTDGDARETVLNTKKWDRIVAHTNQVDVAAEADKAINEFFAPLNEALSKVQEMADRVVAPDPAFTIVLSEGVEATQGEAKEVIQLDHQTAVVRMLASGDTSRLVWVGNNIEILELEPETVAWSEETEAEPAIVEANTDVDQAF